MNEKLTQEFNKTLNKASFPWGDFGSYDKEYIIDLCKNVAQCFYNLALDDVKKEIEKRVSRNKYKKALQNIPEKRHQDLIEGQLLGELKSFIEKQEV